MQADTRVSAWIEAEADNLMSGQPYGLGPGTEWQKAEDRQGESGDLRNSGFPDGLLGRPVLS